MKELSHQGVARRPRVLLCPDTPNWAYDNICDHIERNLSDRFEFKRFYMAGVMGYPEVFLNQVFMILEEFDILHLFWREDAHFLTNPESIYKAATAFRHSPEDFFAAMSRVVVTSSVYDHLHLEPQHFPWRERAFSFIDGYSVSSRLLDGIYREIDIFPDPLAIIPDGVDTDCFTPKNLERLTRVGCPLVVGWVGNPHWGNDPVRDPKGLHSILIPALERLKEEGVEVVAHFADSTIRMRNRQEMAEYYSEIDVLVCTSESEGTPNPVLEAMASGVPIISTRVGIVPDALGPRQHAFILSERSVDALVEALGRLTSDRTLLVQLSNENLNRAGDWCWSKTTQGWPTFWDAAAGQHSLRRALKHHLLRERYSAWYADNVKYNERWLPAAGPAKIQRRMKERIVDWIYRNPQRARLYNKLRGRS
ncbi:D-inositol 3-phosphate glycosyltransferase [Halioglobus japonicus]|nr:D-inositol 3-phosphate glycosyltransferase [Halioglobus japonicus]